MSIYKEKIKEIRKEYPLNVNGQIYVENPLDCAFMIEVDVNGIETPPSVSKNLQRVAEFRYKRSTEYYKRLLESYD